jgi:hypothetical protein
MGIDPAALGELAEQCAIEAARGSFRCPSLPGMPPSRRPAVASMTADEAKAIVDRFAAADPSMATIAAVAKQLIDQAVNDAEALSAADRLELAEFRAKADAERIADAARKRRM